MTVEELIEELRALPATAFVYVCVRKSLDEFRNLRVESVVYSKSRVIVQLDE